VQTPDPVCPPQRAQTAVESLVVDGVTSRTNAAVSPPVVTAQEITTHTITANVSNMSKFRLVSLVQFKPGTRQWEREFLKAILDDCNSASFTTNNRAFQPDNFVNNEVSEF
jgi:hypothetical protein